MKLVFAISLSATLLTLFGATNSALLKKSDALEFLGKIRKSRDVDGDCAGGRCTSEEDNDVFDDTNFVMHLHTMTESPPEPTMIPQESSPSSVPPDNSSL